MISKKITEYEKLNLMYPPIEDPNGKMWSLEYDFYKKNKTPNRGTPLYSAHITYNRPNSKNYRYGWSRRVKLAYPGIFEKKIISYEMCLESAKNAKNKRKWSKKHRAHYTCAARNGWLSSIYKNLKWKEVRVYDYNSILSIAKKYSSPLEWQKEDKPSYVAAQTRGFNNKINKIMGWENQYDAKIRKLSDLYEYGNKYPNQKPQHSTNPQLSNLLYNIQARLDISGNRAHLNSIKKAFPNWFPSKTEAAALRIKNIKNRHPKVTLKTGQDCKNNRQPLIWIHEVYGEFHKDLINIKRCWLRGKSGHPLDRYKKNKRNR